MAEPKRFKASDREIDAAQRNFDFLMPFRKSLLTTPEVTKVVGREQDYVRELIEDGRLEAHSDTAFGVEREVEGQKVPPRKSHRVTRRSVLVYLARTAQYDPAQFIDSFKELLATMTPDQLTKLIVMATQERARR